MGIAVVAAHVPGCSDVDGFVRLDAGGPAGISVDVGPDQDSVLYRTADGYRLAQVRPRPGGLGPVHAAVTVSEHPAPRLTLAAAAARLEALGQPFLFFVNSETRRGNLIYHPLRRNYGVITPPGS